MMEEDQAESIYQALYYQKVVPLRKEFSLGVRVTIRVEVVELVLVPEAFGILPKVFMKEDDKKEVDYKQQHENGG